MNKNMKKKLEDNILKKVTVIDERQKIVNDKAWAGSGKVALFFAVAIVICDFCFTKNYSRGVPFLVLLFILATVHEVILLVNKEIDIPKTFTGRVINTQMTKQGKTNRLKMYLLDSTIYATIMTILFCLLDLDIIQEKPIVLIIATAFLSDFFIAFIFNYLLYNWKVKKFNKVNESFFDD